MRSNYLWPIMAMALVSCLVGATAAWGDDVSAAPATSASAPAGASPAPAPAGPERPRPKTFAIQEIAVDGNTVADESDIQETLAPFLGPDKTVQDVDKARNALQALYRELGFQTVSVAISAESRKTLADGLIILKVDEGHIHKLSITGAKYFSIDRIREQVPALQEGQVPDFDEVQRELADLNRFPDRQVTPDIKRDEATGDLDVNLDVKDKAPFHGLAELNNRYSYGTSHQRAMALLSWDNMRQRGDSLALMTQTAPQRPGDGTVYFGSYTRRFADPLFSMQFSALHSSSDVASVGGSNIVGQGKSVGAKGIWQSAAIDGWSHTVSVGIDYKDFLNRVQLGSTSLDSPLIYYPLTVSFSESHQSDAGSERYGADLMVTLPGLGSESHTIDLSRYAARRQMHWLRASTAVTRELPHAFEAAFTGSGQITDEPLVSNEQTSIGGMDTVRGYLEAESTGDLGLLGSAELRSPPVTLLFAQQEWAKQVNEGRLFFFVDAGHTALRGPLPDASQRDHADLYSLGAGMTLGVFAHWNTALDWSDPLVDGPYTRKGDHRMLFRFWANF